MSSRSRRGDPGGKWCNYPGCEHGEGIGSRPCTVCRRLHHHICAINAGDGNQSTMCADCLKDTQAGGMLSLGPPTAAMCVDDGSAPEAAQGCQAADPLLLTAMRHCHTMKEVQLGEMYDVSGLSGVLRWAADKEKNPLLTHG
jgi:hypothetical protein